MTNWHLKHIYNIIYTIFFQHIFRKYICYPMKCLFDCKSFSFALDSYLPFGKGYPCNTLINSGWQTATYHQRMLTSQVYKRVILILRLYNCKWTDILFRYFNPVIPMKNIKNIISFNISISMRSDMIFPKRKAEQSKSIPLRTFPLAAEAYTS